VRRHTSETSGFYSSVGGRRAEFVLRPGVEGGDVLLAREREISTLSRPTW
jgi:hypothetical protein